MERIAEIDHAFCKPELFSKQRLLINGLKSGNFPAAVISIRSLELLQDIISALLGQQCNSKISRQTRFRYHDIVAKTEEQLLQNLPDTLCLDALAKEIGVSPFHLCRVFKLINGVSILDFVLQVRLRFSLEALSLDQDIAQVATDHGFSSHSHYSTRFKRVFGCTPNAYRQTLSTVE